ncbi:MAG: hypothetical protein ABSF28_03605 [Terracidiphilus sp.]
MNEISANKIRSQVERLTSDPQFASSKRSTAFLRFIVEQTLEGKDDLLKERTIGVEVFGRSPSYDTNVDHVVRTAALELRKRLAIYYGDPQHRSEVRITLVPGSYRPHFTLPGQIGNGEAGAAVEEGAGIAAEEGDSALSPSDPKAAQETGLTSEPHSHERTASHTRRLGWTILALVIAAACIAWLGYSRGHDPERQFWGPLVEGPGPVLIAVGTARIGVPEAGTAADGAPMVIPSPPDRRYIPYADAVTTAMVVGEIKVLGKKVEIRRSMDVSFSDLRDMPTVLVGAFDNPWSLRLMRGLRYNLQVDGDTHAVYIRDSRNPGLRAWEWKNNPTNSMAGSLGSAVTPDYALVSRVRDVGTGRMVVLIAGLEPYGTQAAGEFVTDPDRLKTLAGTISIASNRNLQIVLETTVTDGTPGDPRVVASWQE